RVVEAQRGDRRRGAAAGVYIEPESQVAPGSLLVLNEELRVRQIVGRLVLPERGIPGEHARGRGIRGDRLELDLRAGRKGALDLEAIPGAAIDAAVEHFRLERARVGACTARVDAPQPGRARLRRVHEG